MTTETLKALDAVQILIRTDCFAKELSVIYKSCRSMDAEIERLKSLRGIAGTCDKCGGYVYHRPNKAGEYDHTCGIASDVIRRDAPELVALVEALKYALSVIPTVRENEVGELSKESVIYRNAAKALAAYEKGAAK